MLREQHADKRQQVGENSPLEMGRDADDQRKQEEGSDEKGQGLPHRQQAKQAAKGDGNPFSPLETVKHRKGVAEYRGRNNQCKGQSGSAGSAPQVKPDRDRAFQKIPQQRPRTAPEAPVSKGVCRAGIPVLAPVINMVLPQQSGENPGIEHAA